MYTCMYVCLSVCVCFIFFGVAKKSMGFPFLSSTSAQSVKSRSPNSCKWGYGYPMVVQHGSGKFQCSPGKLSLTGSNRND